MWTIGHGARAQEEFVRLLAQHQIQVLVDVRRRPTSKTLHFRRAALEQWLPQAHVEYAWLGEALGGYRAGGYRRHMTTPLFRTGIEQLCGLAQRYRVCIMCLEISPRGCHRRFIAQHLGTRGVTARHIISARETWTDWESGRRASAPSSPRLDARLGG